MRELEGGRVIELSSLRLDRLDDRIAIVPRIGAPQAGRTVEQFAAVGGDVEHVLGADDQPRLFLEGAVGGEGDPVRLEVVGGGCRFGLWEGHFESPCGSYPLDRKSTRLNSSHLVISYAVFCLKQKKNKQD